VFVSLGASGKFNHTVGVRAAGTIVAVNNDPTAPIFGFADVGVVGDWRTVLTELAPLVEAARKER
jgi:electron transfer flavoprotein alpha subunit